MFIAILYCLAVHAGFYGDVVECRGFDPQLGQKVIRMFSPVIFDAQRK